MSTEPHHTINRDHALERRRTLEASSTAGDLVQVAAISLSDFAEQRAGDRGVDDLYHRDFGMELLEELADARNYAAWLGMRLDYTDLGSLLADADTLAEARVEIEDALRYVVTAYMHALEARRLVRELLGEPTLPEPPSQEAREAAAWRALRPELAAHALGVRTASQVAAAGIDQLHALAQLPEELAA